MIKNQTKIEILQRIRRNGGFSTNSKHLSKIIGIKSANPFTLQFLIPDSFLNYVLKNGRKVSETCNVDFDTDNIDFHNTRMMIQGEKSLHHTIIREIDGMEIEEDWLNNELISFSINETLPTAQRGPIIQDAPIGQNGPIGREGPIGQAGFYIY